MNRILVNKQRFFYGWVIVATVTLVLLFTISNPFSVVLKQLMDEFHSNRGMVSLVPSINIIAAAITGLFIGRLIINHSAKKFMLWGNILGGICLLLVSLTRELWQVYILYFLGGITIAGTGAITLFTLLSRWFVKKFGTVSGIAMAAGGIGFMIMAPVFGIIDEHFGWRATYIFLGAIILVVNVPLILFTIKDRPEDLGLLPDGATNTDPAMVTRGNAKPDLSSPGEKLNLWRYLKNPAFWAIGLGFACIQMGDTAVTYHQVSFITDMHIREAVAASALGFTMGLSTIARVGSGWLADRISSRYIAILFLVIEIFGMLLLLKAHNMAGVWLFVIVYGLGVGASATLLPIVLRDAFGSTAFSMLFAVIDIFYKLGISLGTPFAGFMFDATGSYHLVFIITIVLYVIGAVFLFLAFGINPRPFFKTRE